MPKPQWKLTGFSALLCLMLTAGNCVLADEDLVARLKSIQPTTDTAFRLLSFDRPEGGAAEGASLALGPAGSFDTAWLGAPSVHHDGQIYRMWYCGAPIPPYYTGQKMHIGLATSRDGSNWTRANDGKPVMSPGAAGAFDECWVGSPWVMYDGKTWRMWYSGLMKPSGKPAPAYWKGKIPAGWEPRIRIGLATSTDGNHWERENDGKPVVDLGPPGATDDLQAMAPTVLKEGDGYRMWYASNSISIPHTISMATSEDGIHWTKANGGKPVEGLGWYITGPAVYRLADEYLMLYSRDIPEPNEYGAKGWGVAAAVSRDGVHWRVLNKGKAVAHPGPLPPLPESGVRAGENGSTFHSSGMLRQGNALRFWYAENPASGAYRLAEGKLTFDWE